MTGSMSPRLKEMEVACRETHTGGREGSIVMDPMCYRVQVSETTLELFPHLVSGVSFVAGLLGLDTLLHEQLQRLSHQLLPLLLVLQMVGNIHQGVHHRLVDMAAWRETAVNLQIKHTTGW